MIELIFETIVKEKLKFLNILRTIEVYLSSYDKCILITLSTTTDVNDLCSNQEEADTKIVIHALHSLHYSQIPTINIRSPSGDTDILVLTIVHLYNYKEKIHLDNGTGVIRSRFLLGVLQLKDEILNALIGFHSFTGNDYVSSFFRKGKQACWKVFVSNSRFQIFLSALCACGELSKEIADEMEEFACRLYGFQEKDINTVRYEIFTKKNKREKKVVDLSVLPPCTSVLYYHTLRANTSSMIWKHAVNPNVVLPDFKVCRWKENGELIRMEEPFPKDIEEMMSDSRYQYQYDYGSENESNNELDEFDAFS